MPIVVSHQPSASLTLQLAEAGGKGEYRKWHAQFEQQQEDQKTQAFLGAFGMGSQIGLAGRQMKHQKSMQTARFAHDTKMGNIKAGLGAANAAANTSRENATREADVRDLSGFFKIGPLDSTATRNQQRSLISRFAKASANDADANRPDSDYRQKVRMLQEIRGRQSAGDAYNIAGSRSSQQSRNQAAILAATDNDPRLGIIPGQLERASRDIASRTVAGQTIMQADDWGRGGLVGTATDPARAGYTGETAHKFLEDMKTGMRPEQANLRARIRKEIMSKAPVRTPVYDINGNRVLNKERVTDPITGHSTVEDSFEPGVQVEKMIEDRVMPYLQRTHEREVKRVEKMAKSFSDGQKEMTAGGGETQFMKVAPNVPNPAGGKSVVDPNYPSGLMPRETWTAPGGYVMHLADMPGNRGKPRHLWQWPQNFMGLPKEVRAAPAEGEERGLLKWPPGPNSDDYDVDDWIIPPTAQPMATTRPELYREVRRISKMHEGHPHWSHEIAKQIHLQEGVKIETAEDKRQYDPEPGQLATGGRTRGLGLRGLKPHERITKIHEYGVRQGLFPEGTPRPLSLDDAEYQLRTAMSQQRQMTPDPLRPGHMEEQPSHIGPPPGLPASRDWSKMRESGQQAMSQVEGAEKKFLVGHGLLNEQGRVTQPQGGLEKHFGDKQAAKIRSSMKAFDTLRKLLPGVADPSHSVDPNELQGLGFGAGGPESDKQIQAAVRDAIRTLKDNGDLPETDTEEGLLTPTGPKSMPASQDPRPQPGRAGATRAAPGKPGGLIDRMRRLEGDPRFQGPRNARAKQVEIGKLRGAARKILEKNQAIIEAAEKEQIPLEALGPLGAEIKAARQILGGK